MQDPTAGLHVYLEPLSTSSDYSSSSKFSDPLCFSKTDVSLYNMQPSMTGFEAWSTTLSMIECWSKDGIETINPEQQADIITPASEDDGRGLTSSNNISPFPSTSGIITKASNPSDSTFTNPGYPPIIIQPAYPTSATKPLPSLVTKTNASNIARIGCGGIVSILSLIAVVILL
ncbi:hypothetical protein Q7P35_007798 [Cladosporium inversicolor]